MEGMKMRFVNLTCHVIRIASQTPMEGCSWEEAPGVAISGYGENPVPAGTRFVGIPPSGRMARLDTRMEAIGTVGLFAAGVVTYGDVKGLPEPQDGVVYLVSGKVRQAVPRRSDVFSPDKGSDSVRVEGGVWAVFRLCGNAR